MKHQKAFGIVLAVGFAAMMAAPFVYASATMTPAYAAEASEKNKLQWSNLTNLTKNGVYCREISVKKFAGDSTYDLTPDQIGSSLIEGRDDYTQYSYSSVSIYINGLLIDDKAEAGTVGVVSSKISKSGTYRITTKGAAKNEDFIIYVFVNGLKNDLQRHKSYYCEYYKGSESLISDAEKSAFVVDLHFLCPKAVEEIELRKKDIDNLWTKLTTDVANDLVSAERDPIVITLDSMKTMSGDTPYTISFESAFSAKSNETTFTFNRGMDAIDDSTSSPLIFDTAKAYFGTGSTSSSEINPVHDYLFKDGRNFETISYSPNLATFNEILDGVGSRYSDGDKDKKGSLSYTIEDTRMGGFAYERGLVVSFTKGRIGGGSETFDIPKNENGSFSSERNPLSAIDENVDPDGRYFQILSEDERSKIANLSKPSSNSDLFYDCSQFTESYAGRLGLGDVRVGSNVKNSLVKNGYYQSKISDELDEKNSGGIFVYYNYLKRNGGANNNHFIDSYRKEHMNLLLVDSTNQATSSSKFSPLTSGKVRIAGINYTTEETSTGSTPVWTATYSVNEKNTNEQTRKISPIYVPSSNDIKDDNMKNSPYLAFSKGFILDGIDAYYSYATGSGKTVIDRGLLYHEYSNSNSSEPTVKNRLAISVDEGKAGDVLGKPGVHSILYYDQDNPSRYFNEELRISDERAPIVFPKYAKTMIKNADRKAFVENGWHDFFKVLDDSDGVMTLPSSSVIFSNGFATDSSLSRGTITFRNVSDSSGNKAEEYSFSVYFYNDSDYSWAERKWIPFCYAYGHFWRALFGTESW